MSNDPEFETWKQRALDADILAVAQELGATLKRSGAGEWVGPCPSCGGDDRFGVNTVKRVFLCRGSAQGDIISMVQHIEGCNFVAAVESITKEAAPRGQASDLPDPEVEKERREERKQAERDKKAKVEAADEASTAWAVRVFEAARPIKGTLAEVYLKTTRGLHPTPEQLDDFRFSPSLPYHGYADEHSNGETKLGDFPAMVAAIRDITGKIIGVHRTFLDPAAPIKLKPPGWQKKNRAKKVGGKAGGGLIHLGQIGRAIAIGEGIETTLSFYELGYGPDDLTIAAGYSLGNLSGAATGSLPHPKVPKRSIYNGEPNMERPGMVLPDQVEEVYLLGDGDSDPAITRAYLLTAARRFRALGKTVFVCMAPDKKDFNDVLLDEQRGLK